jgi:hypothetical protein
LTKEKEGMAVALGTDSACFCVISAT